MSEPTIRYASVCSGVEAASLALIHSEISEALQALRDGYGAECEYKEAGLQHLPVYRLDEVFDQK